MFRFTDLLHFSLRLEHCLRSRMRRQVLLKRVNCNLQDACLCSVTYTTSEAIRTMAICGAGELFCTKLLSLLREVLPVSRLLLYVGSHQTDGGTGGINAAISNACTNV